MYELSTAGATLTVRANGSTADARRAIEHAPIGVWPLALALLATLLVAAVAVARQARLAIAIRPALALRA
jgi:hypothetical protein